MSILEKYNKAHEQKDEASMREILHDDFKFTMHASGNVLSKDDVIKWYDKLVGEGIDVIGPTNHDDWIYSIYFFDPNNLRLEITTRLNKK